jgi:Mycobacterial 4 TMS phage holin, superfamily IV
MIRFLLRTLIYFLSALVGLIAADLILGDNLNVSPWSGFVWVALIFGVVQAILSPLIGGQVSRNARAFSGGSAIISTLIALFITNIATTDLQVSGGLVTWILAALIIWLFGALAAFVLPFIIIKNRVEERRS